MTSHIQRIRARFAPSPTGRLHPGHAYSAVFSYNFAREHGGDFILRIEDIDPTRCRDDYIQDIYDDLEWLGLSWEMPVRVQSQQRSDYARALTTLNQLGVLYPCFCTRKEIREEAARAGYAPHSLEGLHYPGTCRTLSTQERTQKIEDDHAYALRLDIGKAGEILTTRRISPLTWYNAVDKQIIPVPLQDLDDIIIARKDIGTSYQLSVVIDDDIQNITHVTRGTDLAYATPVQRVLQELLNLRAPYYVHHNLICADDGTRFAKRDNAITLHALRENGATPPDIFQMIGIKPVQS